MPGVIPFRADAGSATCPSGATLIWEGQGADMPTQQANVKAVYAMLLLAKVSDTTVNLYGNNADNNGQCIMIEFIHLQ